MSQIQLVLDDNTVNQLDELVSTRSVSREETVKEAIYNLWLQEQVNRGIKDIEAGRFITNEEAKANAARRRAKALTKVD